MFRVKKIDHLAICVENLADSLKPYQDLLGLKAGEIESSSELKTDAILLPIGESCLELIAPHKGNIGLEKFLANRGPGLHHIAIEVEGLDFALAFLKTLGVPLINPQPEVGARGHRVAFIHPRAFGGVLVELVEESPKPQIQDC